MTITHSDYWEICRVLHSTNSTLSLCLLSCLFCSYSRSPKENLYTICITGAEFNENRRPSCCPTNAVKNSTTVMSTQFTMTVYLRWDSEETTGRLTNNFRGIFQLATTRRPASADRTARRQFQATGQPVSRTHASDVMTSRLPRYEAKCVQRRCFQCGPVPLRSGIKGTELPPANILIPLERQLIALQLCCWEFLYTETLQQTFRPVLSKLSKRR